MADRTIRFSTSVAFVCLAMGWAGVAMATCAVPNTLSNGQVADASAVMGNFNAVGACADAAVAPSGTPVTGSIPVFSGPKAIASGDLTGDVTTSGSMATTLSNSGVTPGSYVNANITVDAKGRITTAANGAAGSGTLTLISEVVTSGSQANVTFSSIPSAYRDLIIKVRGRSNRASNNFDTVLLQFNADTGSNYEYARIGRAVSGTFADGSTSQTSAYIGAIPAATSTANLAGIVEATIGDYRGTTFYKSINGRSTGGGAGDTYSAINGVNWRSTSAITSITVLMIGTFVNGSIVSLYGSM